MPDTTVSYDDVLRATQVLKGVAHRTPVLTSHQADVQANANVFFKCENFQRVGAFKFRGAYFAIKQLDAACRRRGVIAYSSGNHAQAIALAARILGVAATIVMPSDAPSVKLAATRGYGANVVLYDKTYETREAVSADLVAKHGWSLIPPFDHPDVIAGQGTVAQELFEDLGTLDYLLVPIGGGGLLSGCALVAQQLAPHCQVIGVEPATANDAQQSFQQQRIVTIPLPDTIADGARTQSIGRLVLPILLAHVAKIITVSDAALQQQMRFFAERMKIVVEPTGCLAAAAALGRVINMSGARVGIIVSGGNVDTP